MRYISLGAQCITPELFKKLGLKEETLPFDWALTTPEFVYTILHHLLVENLSPTTIVYDHFFCCDKRSKFDIVEHYTTVPNGFGLLNSKYNVIFPHDAPDEHLKYIRRMERLRNIILDTSAPICFVYVSTSSQSGRGAFTVDGHHVIKNIPTWIEKIDSLLHAIRNDYTIWVFTTSLDTDERSSNERITYINMPSYDSYGLMLPHVVEKFAAKLSDI